MEFNTGGTADSSNSGAMTGGTMASSMYKKGGGLKPIPKGNKGLPKLPESVRNKMGYMAKGGGVESEYIVTLQHADNGELLKLNVIGTSKENAVDNAYMEADLNQPYEVYSVKKSGSLKGKKKKLGLGGRVSNINDATATSDLKDELRSKMKKGDDVIHFAYTDYGGDFMDKVAIEYFEENYPKNTLSETTAYYGKNAFVFGKPATEWIESTEDYPLGFEDFESYYYEKQNEQENEDFERFLDDLKRDGYEVSDEAIGWLNEKKGGYYNITTQGLDFSYSDLEDELKEEGLITKDEMAKGGGTKKNITTKKTKTMDKKWSKKIDKAIKAKKPGFRKSPSGGYYEYRSNRSDVNPKMKLEWGGTAESSETGEPIGGENQSSMFSEGGNIGGFTYSIGGL